jgi:hypothetical protein
MRALSALALTLILSAGTAARAQTPAAPGKDFIEEARKIYRDVACGGPDHPENGHCKELVGLYDKYRTKWLQPAMPWLAKLLPGCPRRSSIPSAAAISSPRWRRSRR